jgi:hypothetical protein
MPLRLPPLHALAGLVATLGLAHAALAEGGQGRAAVPLLPKYQQECGACHLAYPPGLLPAASWQRLAGDLPHHFGVDASLDPALTRELSAWLTANAATGKRAGTPPPQDRITRSAWFVREHGEVPSTTWKLPAVKSPAQCSACHTQAEQGDFNERNVRIPR